MAEHLDRLHDQFGSNKAIHRRFGLDPANIGRTRKVTALPAAVLDLIQDRHEISARRASVFMSAWEKPAVRRKLEKDLASLARAYPEKLEADAVFDALDATISRPAKVGTTHIDDADTIASKAVDAEAVLTTSGDACIDSALAGMPIPAQTSLAPAGELETRRAAVFLRANSKSDKNAFDADSIEANDTPYRNSGRTLVSNMLKKIAVPDVAARAKAVFGIDASVWFKP